jgi:hypothetical protein
MTSLKRALIEKADHDHGVENDLPAAIGIVSLGSARHQTCGTVSLQPQLL